MQSPTLLQQQQQQQPILNSSNNNLSTSVGGGGAMVQQQHQQQIGPECSGCLNLINERYYLSVNDRVWHLNCLRCSDCKLCLDSQQSCFAKDGFIYCKDDYFKWVQCVFIFFLVTGAQWCIHSFSYFLCCIVVSSNSSNLNGPLIKLV